MSETTTPVPEQADIDARYKRAQELMKLGREAQVQGHALLQEIKPHITDARTRGWLNQQSWEAERAAGQRAHYFSQSGQDAFLEGRVFQGKRDGTFVEIGGYDGITGSNCLFFEMFRGWQGLLVEPSPEFFPIAASFRRCTCQQRAVAATEGKAEFLNVREGYKQMSGLVQTYEPTLREQVEADPRYSGEVIEVETVSLDRLLSEAGYREIDYISLDVEGAELAVLQGFPFEKYRITAWTIENNTRDRRIPELMQVKGYKRVEALGQDDVFVRDGA